MYREYRKNACYRKNDNTNLVWDRGAHETSDLNGFEEECGCFIFEPPNTFYN